jgi:hypothetical protein
MAKEELPFDEAIETAPTSAPTFENLEKNPNRADKTAVDDEGMPENIKTALKRAKFYARKAKQLLSTLEQENNPPQGEPDGETEKEKAKKDIRRAKLALRYAIEAQRLYNLVESIKANKVSVVVDSSPERPLSPLSSFLGEVGKEPHVTDNLTLMERVEEAPTDTSIARSSRVEQSINVERVSSHVIYPPSTLGKSSFVELNDGMPVERARSAVFWPRHLSQDVESIMSEKTTGSEALAIMERKRYEQKRSKEHELFSSTQDFVECGGELEPTLAGGNEEFEFDNSFVNQEHVHDRVAQELEAYPATFTATMWQPLKDGVESASSCAQDSVAPASCTQDVAFPKEDGAISSGDPFDVQPFSAGDSRAIDEESRSSIDKYDALEHIAYVNEGITGNEHIANGIGESDKYAVDEITARSVVIMSDPTSRHRSNTVSSEVCEEIDVIYENSDDTSRNGSDWIPDDDGDDDGDDSESTVQYESFTIRSEATLDDSIDSRSEATLDDSTDSESESSDSEASGSEMQEEIEVFEESDYSDVSSRSKYSTCSDDSSEYSDDTTMSEAIAREIREAIRIFGFLS